MLRCCCLPPTRNSGGGGDLLEEAEDEDDDEVPVGRPRRANVRVSSLAFEVCGEKVELLRHRSLERSDVVRISLIMSSIRRLSPAASEGGIDLGLSLTITKPAVFSSPADNEVVAVASVSSDDSELSCF